MDLPSSSSHRPFWKSPTPFVIVLGAVLLFFVALAGWQAWANRNVHAAVEQLKAVDLTPVLAPRPVSIEELVPFRKESGNAAEDLLMIVGVRAGSKGSNDVAGLFRSAASKTRCDWYAPGCLPVKMWPKDTSNISALSARAKTFKSETDEMISQGRLKEAEQRLLALVSVGEHFKRQQWLISMVIGYSIQAMGAKELPALYDRMGNTRRRDLAKLFGDDSIRRQRTLQSIMKVLQVGPSSFGSTAEGVDAWKWMMGHRPLADVFLWEGVMNIGLSWSSNPLEMFFGPAAFREQAVHDLTRQGDVATQQWGTAAVQILRKADAMGTLGRFRLMVNPTTVF